LCLEKFPWAKFRRPKGGVWSFYIFGLICFIPRTPEDDISAYK
jgi:hypothetical protein